MGVDVKSKKIIIVSLLVVILLAIILSGLLFKSDKISIGVIAPLTGGASELGLEVQRGIDLANASLDNKYALVYEDDACSADKAIAGAQKLILIDDIKYVIGPLCAPSYLATANIFEESKISFMHTSGVTQKFIDYSNIYGIPGITTTISEEDNVLAEFAYNKLGIKKIGVLTWNQEWAMEHRSGFIKRFTELGGQVVLDELFSIDESDFKTLILKLKNSGAEALFTVELNFQSAMIVNQMKSMNVNLPVLSQFEIEDISFLNEIEDTNNIYYTYPKIDYNNKETIKFIENYKTKFGKEPSYYAFIGYDSLKLYDFAINKCNSDTKCVTETILKSKDFDGVSGKITYDSTKRIVRELIIKEIQNGKPLPY